MPRLLKAFAAIVGPAAVMAAGTMGAGSTSSLILAGAWFGYELLWVALLILPLFVIAMDSAARIGMVNHERGMFSLIREYVHPAAAWLILAVNVPVHLFIAMAHMSIMTSASLSLAGIDAPAPGAPAGDYRTLEVVLSLAWAAVVLGLLLSGGYQRMQRVMTAFMVLMLICFFVVAARGFRELDAILAGFVPAIPPDLPVPDTGLVRESSISILAVIGSVLAPAALLGIPYMSADAQSEPADFGRELRKSVINLGCVYGGYSMFVIIAGGFALYPLANHAEIDSVHEAGRVLVRAFPEGYGFLGPMVFSLGMLMAALTTFVVIAEVISYFWLDMFRHTWHYTADNRHFKAMIAICIVAPAVLAPLWNVPALLKNLLLMGVNTVVIPLVFFAVLVLINRRAVMGEHTAGLARNLVVGTGLALCIGLAALELPNVVHTFTR